MADLTVQGSQISADKNLTLAAAKNINLIASADTETNQSQNKSSSTSIGVSVGVGKGSAGLSLDVFASRGKGNANSSSNSYNNTQITAGETLTVNSGADTNIIGANVSGKKITATVGDNLNIESLQDAMTSTANQSNSGFTVSIPINGVNPINGSISNSRQKSNANYASVYQQSGLAAGDQGFNIAVQGNTDLKGAVITSTATADNNQITTGTLTTSDVQNKMDAKASTSGTSLSTDMVNSKYAAVKGLTSNLMNNGKAEVSDNSITLSAIAPAAITITDEAKQKELTGKTKEETVAMLNRDTTNTNRVLAKPDVEALQQKAQLQQADSLLLANTLTTFTDESFRKAFLAKAEMYEVLRDDEGKVKLGDDHKPIMRILDETEKLNLKTNGDNKKLNVFTNGIFNTEASAGKYTVQMTEAPVGEKVYLVYFPEANNFFSELLIAGYQKSLEGTTLGLSNATQEIVNLSQTYGQDGLNLTGHSRGAMTIGNALEALKGMDNLQSPLSNTTVKLVGSAYNAQDAANSLNDLSGGKKNTVQLQVHADDFVGRLLGGNPATYGETPVGSSLIKEWINMFVNSTTVHNCGGDASIACIKKYGDPITISVPAKQPVDGGWK